MINIEETTSARRLENAENVAANKLNLSHLNSWPVALESSHLNRRLRNVSQYSSSLLVLFIDKHSSDALIFSRHLVSGERHLIIPFHLNSRSCRQSKNEWKRWSWWWKSPISSLFNFFFHYHNDDVSSWQDDCKTSRGDEFIHAQSVTY